MKKIILASKSPRRLELLRMLGLNVETASPDIDESAVEADSPSHLAEKLAKTKAEKVYRDLHPEGCPVVAADTLVEIGGKILGKPRSVAEAGEMLRMLSGKLHYVHTGLAVIYSGTFASAVETATVHFRELSDDEIESYIMSGEPMDKAGAYGIQGSFAAHIRGIDGSYTNVMGLPVGKLYQELKRICPEKIEDLLKHTV